MGKEPQPEKEEKVEIMEEKEEKEEKEEQSNGGKNQQMDALVQQMQQMSAQIENIQQKVYDMQKHGANANMMNEVETIKETMNIFANKMNIRKSSSDGWMKYLNCR